DLEARRAVGGDGVGLLLLGSRIGRRRSGGRRRGWHRRGRSRQVVQTQVQAIECLLARGGGIRRHGVDDPCGRGGVQRTAREAVPHVARVQQRAQEQRLV